MTDKVFGVPHSLIRKYRTNDPFRIAKELNIPVHFRNMKQQKAFCLYVMRICLQEDGSTGSGNVKICFGVVARIILPHLLTAKEKHLQSCRCLDNTMTSAVAFGFEPTFPWYEHDISQNS